VIPPRNAAGKKTATSTKVMLITGPVISSIALIAASRGDSPFSTWWAAFSTITIASSTTIPIDKTSPKRVKKLIEKPSIGITANAPMIVTGTVVAGTRTARQSCKKTRITKRTKTPASSSVE
jgi:hypothetical protein